MALLNQCMKFEIFLTKSILLKHYEYANKKKYSYHAPGPPNPGFMQEKRTKRGFSKKAIAKIDFFFVLGSYEFLGGAKLESAIFLLFEILYKQCWLCSVFEP